MKWRATRLWDIQGFLVRNRTGGIAFAILYGFGGFFGYALYGELYAAGIADMLTRLGEIPAALPLSPILLCAVLPAFLYCCCMLYCAYERYVLPLWGFCHVLSGLKCGLHIGMLAAAGITWTLALELPLLVGQAGLALLSLDGRREQAGPDAYLVIERFLAPSTAYLIAVSVVQLALTAILARTV